MDSKLYECRYGVNTCSLCNTEPDCNTLFSFLHYSRLQFLLLFLFIHFIDLNVPITCFFFNGGDIISVYIIIFKIILEVLV